MKIILLPFIVKINNNRIHVKHFHSIALSDTHTNISHQTETSAFLSIFPQFYYSSKFNMHCRVVCCLLQLIIIIKFTQIIYTLHILSCQLVLTLTLNIAPKMVILLQNQKVYFNIGSMETEMHTRYK